MKYVSKADAHPAASTPMAYLNQRKPEGTGILLSSLISPEKTPALGGEYEIKASGGLLGCAKAYVSKADAHPAASTLKRT